MSKPARRYVLGVLCERLRDSGWPEPVTRRELVGRSLEDPDLDEHDVEYQLTSLQRTGCIHEIDANSLSIHPTGVEEYESLTDERVAVDGAVTDVLAYLATHDDRDRPGVSRTELLRETDLRAEQLDRSVWFLDERGDVITVSGRREHFLTARITNAGRERIE